jgi:hypothetical protein
MENDYERQRLERIAYNTIRVDELKKAFANFKQVTKGEKNLRSGNQQLLKKTKESASTSEPRRSTRNHRHTMVNNVAETESEDDSFPQVETPLSTTVAAVLNTSFDKTMSALVFITRYSEVDPDDIEEAVATMSDTKVSPKLIITLFNDMIAEGMLERGAVEETTTQLASLTKGRLELSTCRWLAIAAKKVHKQK